jgi:hypothetical protein
MRNGRFISAGIIASLMPARGALIPFDDAGFPQGMRDT